MSLVNSGFRTVVETAIGGSFGVVELTLTCVREILISREAMKKAIYFVLNELEFSLELQFLLPVSSVLLRHDNE